MTRVDQTQNSFLKSLEIQFTVIRALILREFIFRWGRKNIGFLWLFAEPLLFVIVIVAIRGNSKTENFGKQHYGISLIAIILTGYCLAMLWRQGASKSSDAVSASVALMHHRNVTIADLYFSRLILEFISVTAAFLVIMTIFAALEFIPWPQDILLMMTAWFLMIWFSFGYGLVIGSFMTLSDTFSMLWPGIGLALFILSGTFFMVAWLPIGVRDLVLYIPMLHGTEMLRHGYFGDLVLTYENPAYLIAWNLALSFFGLLVIRSPRLIDLREEV
jgi:capsular polysaccharide transport system permease protein